MTSDDGQQRPVDPRATEGSLRVRKKRFIAGAVCPDCHLEDRLVIEWFEVEETAPVERRRRCVACGFVELEVAETERSLTTLPRIRLGAQAQEVAPTPVRMLDPKDLSDK